MVKKFMNIETKLVHAGEPNPRIGNAVSMPIFQSSTFESVGDPEYYDIKYLRLNNTPNHEVLHDKLAALENGEAALVTSSGMAAISTTLLTLLSCGDHLLYQKGLYGGTHELITKNFRSLGIDFDVIDGNDPDTWVENLKSRTKAIYVEVLTNPLLEVADLNRVVEFARSNQLTAIIDNTFATPVNFCPLDFGFDLSLHSGTKYLNGHSDIVAGAVIGRGDLIREIRKKLAYLGGTLDPHTCFLLHRGMKTLAVRVRYQNKSATRIASVLQEHPAIAEVNYPGLPSHPQYERAGELFRGFGGVLSFELKSGPDAVHNFLEKLVLPRVAPSLGGVESLVTLPAATSHSGLSVRERQEMGISEGLVRVSVGLEATEDLIADLLQALEG